MDWLRKLERKYGHLGVKNLMAHIVGVMGVAYLLLQFDRTGTYINKLALIPARVLEGEVWRLFTYIFIPPRVSPLFIIFVLYFYYMIGISLEQEWGTFRFNLYYLLGIVGTTIATFITGGVGTSFYLNLSLFLAFARLYPDYEILLFLILPIKVKYLAGISWFIIGINVLFASLPNKVAAIVAVGNYFVFFGQQIITDIKHKRRAHKHKKKFQQAKQGPIHECTVCGITEEDDPKMSFRYCTTCEGNYEYCMEHLDDHEHIKEEQ